MDQLLHSSHSLCGRQRLPEYPDWQDTGNEDKATEAGITFASTPVSLAKELLMQGQVESCPIPMSGLPWGNLKGKDHHY